MTAPRFQSVNALTGEISGRPAKSEAENFCAEIIACPEEWLPIPGFEGLYEVSDRGRVRSLARTVRQSENRSALRRERILKPSPHRRYLYAHLHKEGKLRAIPVHRLVLTAFVGECPDGMETCHRDGDPHNNYLENLYWGTKSQNTYDRVRHGTHCKARITHCPVGHPYDDANTRYEFTEDGQFRNRRCRACDIRRQRVSAIRKAKPGSATLGNFAARLRAAAELIVELNARDGLRADAPMNPSYLDAEASRTDQQ